MNGSLPSPWRPLALLVAIPLVELYLLIRIGAEIGALITVLWVVASAILGIGLLAGAGWAPVKQLHDLADVGVTPEEALIADAFRSFAGILLILPGFLTDAAGLILLIFRLPLARRLLRVPRGAGGVSGAGRRIVIEGRFWRDD